MTRPEAAAALPRTRKVAGGGAGAAPGAVERFPDELRLVKLNARNWRVAAEYRFRSAIVGLITVPAGTVTDLASVPWFARCFVATDGEWTKPAIVHDWLYQAGAAPAVTRRTADRVFLEAMTVRGVSPVLRTLIYLAVRVGGGAAFRRAAPAGAGSVTA